MLTNTCFRKCASKRNAAREPRFRMVRKATQSTRLKFLRAAASMASAPARCRSSVTQSTWGTTSHARRERRPRPADSVAARWSPAARSYSSPEAPLREAMPPGGLGLRVIRVVPAERLGQMLVMPGAASARPEENLPARRVAFSIRSSRRSSLRSARYRSTPWRISSATDFPSPPRHPEASSVGCPLTVLVSESRRHLISDAIMMPGARRWSTAASRATPDRVENAAGESEASPITANFCPTAPRTTAGSSNCSNLSPALLPTRSVSPGIPRRPNMERRHRHYGRTQQVI